MNIGHECMYVYVKLEKKIGIKKQKHIPREERSSHTKYGFSPLEKCLTFGMA